MAIGHLGKDAVTNKVNGKQVINFTVAHSEKYRNSQGEQVDKTTWLECGWWNDSDKIAQYLNKGTQVFIEGVPEVRTFAKNDGTTGVSLSVRVFSLQLLGGGKGETVVNNKTPNAKQAAPQPGANSPADNVTEPIDDLPF